MRPSLLCGPVPPVLLAGLLVLSACSDGARESRPDEEQVAQQRQADLVRPTAAKPLLDLPAALRLRPRALRDRLGPPRPAVPGFIDPGKALNDQLLPIDSLAWYAPRGLTMLVSFRPGTGFVQDVLLLGADETALMRQAALQPDAPGYLVLPVFQPRQPDRLLGLRVVPK